MSIIISALALAASAQPATTPAAQPAGDHSQHQAVGKKQDSKACACCEHMADGKKMACCEQHEKKAGDHAGHAGHTGQ
jgi:hypothetical protein